MSGRRTTMTSVSMNKWSVPLWRIVLLLGASFGTSPLLVSVQGFAPLDAVAHVSIRRTVTENNNNNNINYPASRCLRIHYPDHHYQYVTNSGKRTSCRRHMTSSMDEEDTKPPKKKKRCKTNVNSTSAVVETTDTMASSSDHVVDFESRITQLEQIVSRQEILIQKLRKECNDLTEAAVAFGRVVDLLRQAGLENTPAKTLLNMSKTLKTTNDNATDNSIDDISTDTTSDDDDRIPEGNYEYFDDSEIFGRAPSSVIDAADAAGAAILAGMLGGKQRMLVDVRDAELSRDPETLVQFVELAILPVAAGLEGLRTARNRVKIVFPTVSQLLQYRRTMALAAPEVVALSTLGFDPVEKQDQLVVLIAPSPDDGEGLAAMNELLCPTDGMTEQISQPLVVVNHHMVPVSGPAKDFEVAYHLRLLSVQYMSGENKSDYLEAYERHKRMLQEEAGEDVTDLEADAEDDDEALEAAMKHAHEIGMNQGVTRAMVIRSYPKPWHVFVDTSPDTDADFEVAATFDEEPSQDDVNFAIVECLEGSEREDEIVAQQMQEALEAGQLDRVSEMLGMIAAPIEVGDLNSSTSSKSKSNSNSSSNAEEVKATTDGDEDPTEDTNYYDDFDSFEEDSC